MRHLTITVLIILFSINLNAQKSYIQIEAESGLSVFLDGEFQGKTSSDVGGLIIDNVIPGKHTLRIIKDGFNPQEDIITVKSGEVYPYNVGTFTPKIKISEHGDVAKNELTRQVGSLNLQSLPISITISIPELGISTTKTKDKWDAEGIPVGHYNAVFKWNNKSLQKQIKIDKNIRNEYFVNMIDGTIEDRTPRYNSTSALNSPIEFNENKNSISLKDPRDGKIYNCIQIGTQVWMAENINYDGVSESACYDDKVSNCELYGKLYTWHIAKEVCPTGWHLPSSREWQTLINYLGGNEVAGGKIKEKGISHWASPNGGATNESGFTALPSGHKGPNDALGFSWIGTRTEWWSSTVAGGANSDIWSICYTVGNVDGGIGKSEEIKWYYNPVRCVKD